MAFHTPHGSARYRLPWSWSSFDYRELCRELWAQSGAARFEIAKVESRTGDTVHTDRGDITAPLIVDALGWRRVLGPGENVQPPDALISPRAGGPPARRRHRPRLLDRPLGRPLRLRLVGARGRRAARRRRLLRAAPPRQGADEGDGAPARRRRRPLPGQLVPARAAPRRRGRRVLRRRLRRATACRCRARGSAPAFHFGIACGRELRAVLAGRKHPRAGARRLRRLLRRPRAAPFRVMGALQRWVPRLPPRALTALIALAGRRRPCTLGFDRYLKVAPAAAA